jgi:hypothetical protein
MKSKIISRFLLFGFIAILTLVIFLKFIHPLLIRQVVWVNHHSELVRYYSGKERLRDSGNKHNHTDKFDRISISDTEDSLGIFFDHTFRGYLSLNSGRVVIPGIYTHAWHFSSDGLAVVTNDKNQIGIINRNGKLIVPFKYNYIPHIADFIEEPVYSFSDGLCIITDDNNFGIIDSTGVEKLPPLFKNISIKSKGYYSTLKNGKWGIVDSTFTRILDNEFDNITVLETGLLVKQDNLEYLISFDGKTIISKSIYEDFSPLQYVSSESESSYSPVKSANQSYYESEDDSDNESDFVPRLCKGWTIIRKDEGTGLLRNADQVIIIPCVYVEIKAISNKLFRCKLAYGKYILRDTNGKIVQF